MRQTAYYLITANERLKERAVEDKDLDLVCDSFLVESYEGPGSKSEFILRAKIFVLLNFMTEYAAVPSIATLFKDSDIAEGLFDRWWTIQMAEDVERMPTFGSKFKVPGVPRERLPPTGSDVVDEWIARVVEF